jgi:hypothetical protein
VKAIRALALLAVLGFAAAGCGATKKIVVNVRTTPLRHIMIHGSTATIPNVPTDARIKCRGWRGRAVRVPPRGSTANVGGGKAMPGGTSSSENMQLTHQENGSLIVVCTSH